MSAPTSQGRARTATRSAGARPQRAGAGNGQRAANTGTRTRSAAAERAYQRRAQRSGKLGGSVAGGMSAPQRAQQALGPAPLAPFVVLVMGLLVIGVAATLWLSTQATADSYRLEHATQQARTLAERVEQLQSDVAAAQAPGALAEQARKLGMVPAKDPAHLVVGENGKVRVIGRPSPATAPPPPVPAAPPPATETAPDRASDRASDRDRAPERDRDADRPSRDARGQDDADRADPPGQRAERTTRPDVRADGDRPGNARAGGGA